MGQDAFAQTLAEMARAIHAEPDMQTTLQSTVALAAQSLQGRAEVSISLITKRAIATPASTSQRATLGDALQYELGEGPCVDAAWKHETFQIEDLLEDRVYPRWSPRAAAETGFRGIVSYQLFTDVDTLGALNLYTEDPHPYEAVDRVEGLLFATHAALALQAARSQDQFYSALLTRNLIGQAQGALMAKYGLDAQRAFGFLARLSQDENLKLTVIAQRVIDSLTETGG